MVVTVTRNAPPPQPTGVSVTPVHGIDKIWNEESDTLIDRTTEFTTGSGGQIFTSNEDYLYIGKDIEIYRGTTSYDRRFINLHIKLNINASESVNPTIEYYDNNGDWVEMDIRTDETNGFTQDGTITFEIEDFPDVYTWKSVIVEDDTERYYVRIKRNNPNSITPPTIDQMGTGHLSANTTYYYKVWGMSLDESYSSYPLRSIPSNEVSGTTTNMKRSLKVEWDDNVNIAYYYIMRTPASENYKINNTSTASQTRTDQIDTYAQAVNNGYFYYYSIKTGDRNYTIDIGVPLFFRAWRDDYFVSSYTEYAYFDKPRGYIEVDGGTENTPATFSDIYDADVANGWNTFIKNHTDWANYHNWECYDHIRINGWFEDEFTTIYTSGFITTSLAESCVFGKQADTATNHGGVRFVYFNNSQNNPPLLFKNCTFYGCSINDDARNDRNLARNYVKIYFYDNCNLQDVEIEAEYMIETCEFDGENITANELRIKNSRYGFEITDNSIDTANITNLKIYNRYSISSRSWDSGKEITYRDFSLIDADKPVWNWPGSNDDENYSTIFNLIDFTYNEADLSNSEIGIKSEINEKYSLNLIVCDEDGNAIEGATIIIKDTNGDNITGSPFSTDINGEISEDILYCKYTTTGESPAHSINTYNIDVIDCRSPFTITIQNSGFQEYHGVSNFSEKKNWQIALQEKEYYQQNINANITEESISGNITESNINTTVSISNVSGSKSEQNINAEISQDEVDGEVDN